MSSEQHTPVTHSSSHNYYLTQTCFNFNSWTLLLICDKLTWPDLVEGTWHETCDIPNCVPQVSLKITSFDGRKLGPQPQSSIVCGLCLLTWPLCTWHDPCLLKRNMTKMYSHTYMGFSQHTYKIQFGSMQEKLQQHLFPSPIIDCPWALNWLWEGHTAYKMANLNWIETLAPKQKPWNLAISGSNHL